MLSLSLALVSVCASAQVYIGGTAGISSNKIGDADAKTAYKFIPEIGYQFNNKWEAGIEVGIQKGDVCKKLVNLFLEGTVGYGSVSKGGGDFYEVGIKPGIAVKLSDHVNLISKVGFLGYRGYSPEHGKSSSTFGLDVDASNVSFGAIYKF